MKKEIRSVRVYQAVTFEGKNETTFIMKGTARRPAVKATINKEFGGVELETSKDHIFVPFTNVSGIYFENENSLKKEAAAKAEEKKVSEINKAKKDVAKRPR